METPPSPENSTGAPLISELRFREIAHFDNYGPVVSLCDYESCPAIISQDPYTFFLMKMCHPKIDLEKIERMDRKTLFASNTLRLSLR